MLALLHPHIPKEQQQEKGPWDELLTRTGVCSQPVLCLTSATSLSSSHHPLKHQVGV